MLTDHVCIPDTNSIMHSSRHSLSKTYWFLNDLVQIYISPLNISQSRFGSEIYHQNRSFLGWCNYEWCSVHRLSRNTVKMKPTFERYFINLRGYPPSRKFWKEKNKHSGYFLGLQMFASAHKKYSNITIFYYCELHRETCLTFIFSYTEYWLFPSVNCDYLLCIFSCCYPPGLDYSPLFSDLTLWISNFSKNKKPVNYAYYCLVGRLKNDSLKLMFFY